MKRFGQVPGSNGELGSFRIVPTGVIVPRKLLTELCDRLEARCEGVGIPRDEKTFNDMRAVDMARKLLRP